jgi:hypothetical protein
MDYNDILELLTEMEDKRDDIRGALSCAESCETADDLRANLREAKDYTDELRALIQKAEDGAKDMKALD